MGEFSIRNYFKVIRSVRCPQVTVKGHSIQITMFDKIIEGETRNLPSPSCGIQRVYKATLNFSIGKEWQNDLKVKAVLSKEII